ncbi:MAG: hypothetical protein JST84_04670 [Acidobacteria bacterium]|nr:hypothetical protein [Acidobacteriota bacterium]
MNILLTEDNIRFDCPENIASNDEELAALIAAQFPKYAQVRIERKSDIVEVSRIPGGKG